MEVLAGKPAPTSFLVVLLLSSLLSSALLLTPSQSHPLAASPSTPTAAQTLATIPPGSAGEPFATSPSGNYTATLFRQEKPGGSFCYVRVDGGAGERLWSSDCAPVSDSNPCSLVLYGGGLAVLDGTGTAAAWGTAVFDGRDSTAALLELTDDGELQVSDANGDSTWMASDEPQGDTSCWSWESPLPPPPDVAPPPLLPAMEPLSPPPAVGFSAQRSPAFAFSAQQPPMGSPTYQLQSPQPFRLGGQKDGGVHRQRAAEAAFLPYSGGIATAGGSWVKLCFAAFSILVLSAFAF